MNTTIKEINNTTMNPKVLEFARMLVKNPKKVFEATFTKKNGELRKMKFVPNNAWNEQNGIETTAQGAKMVATKCKNGMATVCEMLEAGRFQCRTLNLASVIDLHIV